MKTSEIKIQRYSGLKKVRTMQDCTVADYINYVREGYNLEMILEARKAGKNSPLYIESKLNRLCFTLNFTFSKLKADANVIGPTGLLYIDVDREGFHPDLITYIDQVAMIHHSFGGKGYGIFVKVSGLTICNTKSTTYAVASALGILSFIDDDAIKATQFTACSYDPNIYVNEDAPVFQAVEPEVTEKIVRKMREIDDSHIPVNTNDHYSGKMRFSNVSDYLRPGESYSIYPNKVYVYEVYKRCNLPDGERYKYILATTSTLVKINPLRSRQELYDVLLPYAKDSGANDYENKLNKALNSVLKYKKEGKLNPKGTPKMVIFDYSLKLQPEYRQAFGAKLQAFQDRYNSRQLIYDCITNWSSNENITIASIAKTLGRSEASIKNYYAPFKKYAKALNKKLEANQMEIILEDLNAALAELNKAPELDLTKARKRYSEKQPIYLYPSISAEELFAA